MNILILASGNITSNFSYRVVALSKSLVKHGHNVTLIAPSADKYNDFKKERFTTLDGIKIIQPFQFATGNILLNLIPYLLHGAWIVSRQHPDLVYIYKPTPITYIGLLQKLLYKTPILLDMDDLGSEVMKIEGHPRYQQRLVEFCEKSVAKHAQLIVAASTFLKDRYQALYPKKSIHLMTNGVERDWFGPIIRTRDENTIVFMGSLNRTNILEPLINAWPTVHGKIPAAKAIIIGDGKYLNYFKQQVNDLEIANSVTFTGWLKLDEAKKLLKSSDIGYNYMPDEPTIKAASNMKVSQYMARGVVPLVSDVGDLPAMVEFGEAGYVTEPGNTDALAQTIIVGFNDSGRDKKAQVARTFAKEHFDWEILAVKLSTWVEKELEIHA